MANVSPNFALRFTVTLKDGDVVEIQEDTSAIVEQQKEIRRPTMSHTITHRKAENQSKNGPQQLQQL